MMKVLALFVSLSVKLLPTLADQLPFEEKTNFLPSAISAESDRRSLENTGSFDQVGSDISYDMNRTNFGTAVSMSEDGSYIAVGAPSFDFVNLRGKIRTANDSGMVRVLKFTGSEWVQVGTDINRLPNNVPNAKFGQAVAISADGSSVAVGAPFAKLDGFVDVYKFNGTDWDQQGTAILGTGDVTMANIGTSVALSDDGMQVIIGAPNAKIDGSNSGSASVFTFDETMKQWMQVGDHVATGNTVGDLCGTSVDISGDGNTAAVGAVGMSEIGKSEGVTRVYQWNDTHWEQKGSDIVGEGDADLSGTSISLSQDATRIAIGAPYNYNLGGNHLSPRSDFGNVRVFEFTGSDWEQLGDSINGFQAKSLFGVSVSLSNDGCRVAVGAPEANVTKYEQGSLHVYDLSNETTWLPFAEPIGGLVSKDQFGHSVSLSGDGMRVGGGALKHDFDGGDLNDDDGQARVFQLSNKASCGGDPHFRSFSGIAFSFHGQCDMVLMKSHGLEVHIRTTRIDRTRMSYSYISAAAVAYGNDVVEAMADGTLIVNGKETIATGEEALEDIHVAKSFSGLRKNIILYDLTFGEKKSIQIRVNTKVGMIFVDAVGHFSETTGLLGSSGGSFARDGVTDMAGLWNSFGEEWQVQAHEPKLFNDGRRAPQYPAGCSYEQVSNTKLRRRLTDASTEVDIDTARQVCSKLRGDMKDYCITDVMITGDVELVDDPFYN